MNAIFLNDLDTFDQTLYFSGDIWYCINFNGIPCGQNGWNSDHGMETNSFFKFNTYLLKLFII